MQNYLGRVNPKKIMDKYYYLISELPHLIFGNELKVTRRYFLEEALKWLDKEDHDCVIRADINEFSALEKPLSDLLCNFHIFEYNLRSELSLWRKAQKEGHEYKSIIFPSSIIKDHNPLEVEQNFLLLRWKFIEEEEIGHVFDLDAVVAYYLKLQILERYFLFEKETGKDRFNQLSRISNEENKSEVLENG